MTDEATGSTEPPTLSRRVVAELLGTALLLVAIVGSGIMADRLAGGNVGLALLANSLATGAGLTTFILVFSPYSGAHFNPVVTLSLAVRRVFPLRETGAYVVAQTAGALLGVAAAEVMFREPVFALSTRERSGAPQILSETIATFGLLSVIWACVRHRPRVAALAVGSYIAAAYWFTASTSFANPAVTLARCLTDTFTGIRPADVPGFVMGQLAGAVGATALFDWLDRLPRREVPHEVRTDLRHSRKPASAGGGARRH